MENRSLDITNMKELKDKMPDVKVHGNPGKWVCVAKASSEKYGLMKSTKVMELGYPGSPVYGSLVQVTTERKNPDGSVSLAEAVTYCPEVNLKMFDNKER